jgi:rhodanese-related sulfurtransferase
MVKTITMQQAEDMLSRDPTWVDVRQPEEHQQSAIEGSINIPLNHLRESLHGLSQDRPCIIFCDNGHRSSCAAYLLNAFGYQAFVLENGVAVQESLVE